jgi:hypothetical protein
MHPSIRAGLLASSALAAVSLAAAPGARAVVNVNTETTLREAIFTANTGGDTAINLTGPITLTQSLPMITSNVNVTATASHARRRQPGAAFFVASGTVAISNLTVANARAGGDGCASNGAAAGRRAGCGCGGVREHRGVADLEASCRCRRGSRSAAPGRCRRYRRCCGGGGGGGGLGGAGGAATALGLAGRRLSAGGSALWVLAAAAAASSARADGA